MKRRKNAAPVIIIWNDIASHQGGEWSEDAKSGGLATFSTVGWITHEDEDSITIYSTIEIGGNLKGHDTCIPKGCIKNIKKLKTY